MITRYLVVFILLAFASCKEEEKDFFAATTDFDQKAFESKVFSLGDTVKIDFLIKFNVPQDYLESRYIIASLGYKFERQTIDPSLKSYLYKFRFPLDPKIFNTVKQTGIIVSTNSNDPKVQGSSVANFLINIK
jgi:hypothetical protein